MKTKTHVRRSLLSRIYKKLLEDNTRRTITWNNIKDYGHDFSKSDFERLFDNLADHNYVFSKPRSDTYILVEDEPRNYAEFLDVGDYVEKLESQYGREEVVEIGSSEKDGGWSNYA